MRLYGAAIAVALAPRMSAQNPLARHYVAGDSIVYEMRAINVERADTLRYEAVAGGRVVRDSSGRFAEQLRWSHLVRGASLVTLPDDPNRGRQTLTLSSDWQSVPNVASVDPRLIGPMLDLFTFYVDIKLAAAQPTIVGAGDHTYLPLGIGGSWADGTRTIIGRDAVDFDITLTEVQDDEARVVVKHLAPATQKLQLPARLMLTPVSDRPNNWVDVLKTPDGRYLGRVGQETFTVDVRIGRADGRVLSARMDNPVEVMERVCTDAALADCGPPTRYRIQRFIELTARRD